MLKLGVFSTGFKDDNWHLNTGAEDRSSSYFISFPEEFYKVPSVMVVLKELASSGDTVRITVNVLDITKEGFTVEFSTWGDSQVWGAGISWLAYTVE